MALEITDATFEEVVLKSDKPVVVDFWAAWCGPCRMVGPIIDEISNEYEGKAVVGKVDVDAHTQFARDAYDRMDQSTRRRLSRELCISTASLAACLKRSSYSRPR